MNINNKLRNILFVAILIFTGFTAIGAQTPTPTPKPEDPLLKACEELADSLKRQSIEISALKALLEIEKERTANAKEATQNAKTEAAFWQKAAEAGTKIDNNSGQIIFQLRQQVADDRLRIKELEDENKSLRKSRDFRTVGGFAIGFGTAWWLKK